MEAVLREEQHRLMTISLPEKREKAARLFDGITDQVLVVLDDIMTAPAENFQKTVVQVMRSFRKICQAQEYLYSLRTLSPHLRRFFVEPWAHDRIEQLDPEPQGGVFNGLIHFGMKQNDYERGTLSLYVPESYTGEKTLAPRHSSSWRSWTWQGFYLDMAERGQDPAVYTDGPNVCGYHLVYS